MMNLGNGCIVALVASPISHGTAWGSSAKLLRAVHAAAWLPKKKPARAARSRPRTVHH